MMTADYKICAITNLHAPCCEILEQQTLCQGGWCGIMKYFLSALDLILIGRRSMSTAIRAPRLLGQEEAAGIDVSLFNECGFAVEQLMELAGQACAVSVARVFPPRSHPRALILCGPGNNGGDGLVCARHLTHFGYSVDTFSPKPPSSELMQKLTKQLISMDISALPSLPAQIDNSYDLIVDALFGFSFKPPVRDSFVPAVDAMRNSRLPVASIDIPSGWDVEDGPDANGINPTLLISLTAPKKAARFFKGPYHYLGGRFVPSSMIARHQLNLPEYPGTEPVVDISSVKYSSQ